MIIPSGNCNCWRIRNRGPLSPSGCGPSCWRSEATRHRRIATCTGFSRRVVQAWVARYNGEGLAGLETKAGLGRKPPLTPEEADQLQQRLDAGPLPDDGVCTLRGKDVQRILESEFGQLRSLNAVYGLLHRLGYSSLVPRPQHPQTDPAAQEEFKKNFASASRRSRRTIPTAGCKSFTKTKRGSASKVR
ncbi:MAG: hypothetical protein CK530_00465 [Planctomycetaceae bacterium]|nr:MAG: hypothetical protein CK530_00465 [Planctomycetaceae bacterium]